MADESIIVEQPVLDYETVDIIENGDTAQIEPETLDIIEVEDIQVFTVETDEAFSSLGKQNEEMKHQHFNGRDLPDQHPITAITGLRGELDSIEALQTIYSDDKQAADYYEWEDGNILLENRVGYFVSICDDIRTIKICTGEDIFGVTVDTAAFIGGQDDVARDNTYGLVAHTGIVTVRCELDVNVGDYVVSNSYGMAKKADNNYGCKVIALHNIKGVLYSAILLNMSINQINEMGYELIDLDKRMDAAETNIVTAINIANKAYDLADDAVKTSEGAFQKADDAVIKANNAMSIVDNSDKQIQEAIKLSAQAKVIADSAVVSAEAIRSEAVAVANKTLVDVTKEVQSLQNEINELEGNIGLEVDKMAESVENLSNTVDEMKTDIDELKEKTVDNLDEIVNDVNDVKDLANRLDNDLKTAVGDIKTLSDELEPLSSWPEGSDNPTGVAGFVAKADEDSAILAGIVEWKGDSGESLAGFVAEATEENATVKTIASYEGGAAGLVAQVNDNKEAIVDAVASVGDSLAGLQARVDTNSASITTLASHTIGEYISIDTWNIADKDTNKIYYVTDTKLYWYYDEEWKSTDKAYKAGLDGALASIQQTVNEDSATLSSIVEWKGDAGESLAGFVADATENNATVKSLTQYQQTDSDGNPIGNPGVAGLIAQVDANKASASLIAEVQDNIAGLQAEVNKNTAAVSVIASVEENIAGLRTDVDKNTAATSVIAEVQDNITVLQTKVNDNESSIGALASFKYGNDLKIYPYISGGNIKINGITFTDNGNRTITINGTATDNADFYLVQNRSFAIGEYSISGCPEGSSTETYCMQLTKTNSNVITTTLENTNDESTFTVESGDVVSAWIRVIKGTSVENITFKPCFKQVYQGLSGLTGQVTKNGSSIDLLTSFSSDDGEGVAGLIAQVSDHDAKLTNLATWKNQVAKEDGTLQVVDAIAAIKQQADDNESSIGLVTSWQENFCIGGRNYILNSAELFVSSLGSEEGSKGEFRYINVGKSYMDIESGTEVVLSFDLEMTVNTANPTLTVYNTNYRGPKGIGYHSMKFTASVGDIIKQRCSIKTTIVDATSPNKEDNHLEFYTTYGTSNWFKISKIKLEKGNQATDWSAAPEDDVDSIAAINVKAEENASAIESITGWQGEIQENITKIEQITGENGASINMLVASIDKYSVGEYSQAYGLTQEQAKNILKEDMIYIPTKHDTNPTHTETYSDTGEVNSFTETYYYTWNGTDWDESASGTVAFSATKPTSNNTLRYWYINSDTAPKGYQPMTLYKADGDKWVKVNIFYNNSRNRTVTSISQEVDAISLEVTDAWGNLSSHQQLIDQNGAQIQDLVTWSKGGDEDGEQYNLATIKQTADTNGARIAQVVSGVGGKNVVILTTAWDATDKSTDTVYYVKPTGLYYYYKNNKWNSTTSTNTAGLKINAASIVTAINDSGSSIVLNADHINLNGAITANSSFTIDTSGYMRATGGSIAGWMFTADKLGSNSKNKKYLILGDSYSVGYYTTSDGATIEKGGWPYKFADKLGISIDEDKINHDVHDGHQRVCYYSDKCTILGYGGMGFTQTDTNGNTKYGFKDLIEKLLIDKGYQLSSFTDIIIGCGWNDQWYGNLVDGEWVMDQTVTKNGVTTNWNNYVPKGMANFQAYLTNQGFQGKVTLFAIGNCCGNTSSTTKANADIRLPALYTLYKSKAQSYGWDFVDLKPWDENKSTYYGSDNFHPNPDGLQRIANHIYYTWVSGFGRLYHNPQGYSAATRGFYLSNNTNDSWAIEIGPEDADFSPVGGNLTKKYRHFLVSHEGTLWAQGAHINGTVVATSGKIGGWNIGNDRLSCSLMSNSKNGFAVDIAVPTAKGNTGNTTTVMAVKSVTDGTTTWPFIVRSDGTLTATKANIKGTITATSGAIGGWNLNSTTLYKNSYNKGTDSESTIFYKTFIQNVTSYSDLSNRAFGVYKYTRKSTSDSWTKDDQFYVNNQGDLYAKNADIQGKITATSGTFKGTIKAGAYIGTYLKIEETSTNQLINLYHKNGGTSSSLAPRLQITKTQVAMGATGVFVSVNTSGIGKLAGTWELSSGAAVTSDRNAKNSISTISNPYEVMFDNLQPVTYKYNEGTSNRIHTGFIAQDVVDAVNAAGLNTKDFAAVCYDAGDDENKAEWGIRYDEFVSLNTWQIQKAKARITELENRVAELEAIIKGE